MRWVLGDAPLEEFGEVEPHLEEAFDQLLRFAHIDDAVVHGSSAGVSDIFWLIIVSGLEAILNL
jgi:hypothetical protein